MKIYNQTFENFNKNYIGCATMAVIGQSCLGAVAAMCVLSNGTSLGQMVQLTIIVFANMFANTSILAQMSHKTVFNIIISTVFFSTLFIIINNI
ncbi:hypothetical protein D3C87_1485030 [compost metagenome]|uniref:hypothetical protein n=1 Tax=Flavobacterium sp. Root186 TaxID=1736485 RepID=UPI0006F2FC6B|nr:hypothetical protein [Flavobacterium sp. Root186]KRB58524.1 hypothetical protein ASD98_23540 [Flavobacterium sp. Root186]